MKSDRRAPFLARFYFGSVAWLDRALTLVHATFSGVWLGLLGRGTLHAADQLYYDQKRSMYCDESYNKHGLRNWERQAIDAYFGGCRSILVAATGGGREVLALRNLEFDADGFECHPELCAAANRLLEREGLEPDVRLAERDRCVDGSRSYDGLVVGWGAYMLIQGRRRRIEFLAGMRERAAPGAPILLSFFSRSCDDRRLRIVAGVANALRRIARRERVEIGDDLRPNYVHVFTRDEIAAELREAGFDLAHFERSPYGHAVGIAAAVGERDARRVADVSVGLLTTYT